MAFTQKKAQERSCCSTNCKRLELERWPRASSLWFVMMPLIRGDGRGSRVEGVWVCRRLLTNEGVRKVVAEPMRVKPSWRGCQEQLLYFRGCAVCRARLPGTIPALQPACLPSSSECEELVTRDNDREVGCIKVAEKSVAEQQEKERRVRLIQA